MRRATGLRHVAIDGKSARSAPGPTSTGCLHLVNAWATENRLILGQESAADGSHEIAAIPELLRVLDLKGAIATIDAAGCQASIAGLIREQGGDYLLAVKGDQPTLHEAVQAAVGAACEGGCRGASSTTGMSKSRARMGGMRSDTRQRSTIPRACRAGGRTWRRWSWSAGSRE